MRVNNTVSQARPQAFTCLSSDSVRLEADSMGRPRRIFQSSPTGDVIFDFLPRKTVNRADSGLSKDILFIHSRGIMGTFPSYR